MVSMRFQRYGLTLRKIMKSDFRSLETLHSGSMKGLGVDFQRVFLGESGCQAMDPIVNDLRVFAFQFYL